MGKRNAEQVTYEKDGVRFCRVHDTPLTPYGLSGAFLLTTYDTDYLVARSHRFPNARWPEDQVNRSPTSDVNALFCEECQKLDDNWRPVKELQPTRTLRSLPTFCAAVRLLIQKRLIVQTPRKEF